MALRILICDVVFGPKKVFLPLEITITTEYIYIYQCFGSGSGSIRIIWPDPDPHQETLIWIRVPKKILKMKISWLES